MSEIPLSFAQLEWLPDQGDHAFPGLTNVSNCRPAATGYNIIKALTDEGNTALTAACRGAVTVVLDGSAYEYAGDNTKLYRLVGSTWTDSSGTSYSMSSGNDWDFARFKDKILAVNGKNNDNPQQITLGGTTFSDLTTDFTSTTIAAVRDFVVHGNTNDATDGDRPERIRWSGYNGETDYTKSAATQSDCQDLKTSGVVKVIGGEYGVVMCEDTVYRMTYEGPPTVFRFDEILPGVGLVGLHAAARHGDNIFALTNQGFGVITNGQAWEPIGANKIDQYALDQIAGGSGKGSDVFCAVDSKAKEVWWSIPVSGGRQMLIFNWALNKWGSFSATAARVIYYARQPDASSTSFLRAFVDSNNQRAAFSGTGQDCFIETSFFAPFGAKRAHVDAVRPVIESNGQVTENVRMIFKDNISSDSKTNGLLKTTVEDDGTMKIREQGRYMALRMWGKTWTGASEGFLKEAVIYATPMGTR